MSAFANHVPVWLCIIGSMVFNKSSKAFIQPQIVPPLHSYKVTKPLKIQTNTHKSTNFFEMKLKLRSTIDTTRN